MIVRERPALSDILFAVRGSVLPRIKKPLAVSVALATAVVALDLALPSSRMVTLTPTPFTLIGLALAIFLGFRNNASYDRWWEGRKLWGSLLIHARSAARLVLAHMEPGPAGHDRQERMVLALVGFAYFLKHHLRDTQDQESQQFLPAGLAAGFEHAANRPDAALRFISTELQAALREGRIDPMMATRIEDCLTGLAGDQAGCERLKTTPLPFSYSLLLHRTAYLYCLALPFGIVSLTGLTTPFVVGLVSYTIFGLDALGDEIEQPFRLTLNNLPLDSLCRRLEIDLLDALGREHLPPVIRPNGFWLT